MIDYAAMNREFPKQKRRLTLALKVTDETARRERVEAECRRVVQEWDDIGAWPDDWARWQRALDSTYPLFSAPDMGAFRWK